MVSLGLIALGIVSALVSGRREISLAFTTFLSVLVDGRHYRFLSYGIPFLFLWSASA